MAGEETIGRATIQLGADGSKLAPEMAAAVAKAQGSLERANKQMERAHASTMKAIQGHINQINATRPTQEMRLLEQAVQKLGGTANLTKDQLGRVTSQVNALAAAGAKVPASLSGLTGMGSKLGAAFSSLTTGGGVSGALAAIGPAGVAAAGALGVVTVAGGAAFRAISDLAEKAEQWDNIAASTGLGATEVQQLSALLEDAGIPAEALGKAMKELQKEIATGGKELEKFGIDVAKLKDLTPEEQFRAMATQIAAIEDPADRTAVALAAFGRSGTELLPVMDDVASGADKMYDALDPEQRAALKKADATLDAFGRKWEFTKNTVLASIVEMIQAYKGFAGTIPIFLPDVKGAVAGAAAKAAGAFNPKADAGEAERKRKAAEFTQRAANEKAERAAESARKKADEDHLRAVKAQNDAAVALIKAREDETKAMERTTDALAKASFDAEDRAKAPAEVGSLGSVRDAAQAAYENGIKLAQAAQQSGLGLDQITKKLEGMGLTAEEAASIVDVHLAKQEEAIAEAKGWDESLDSLAQQLQVLAATTGGLTGKIVSFAASLASGLGGALAGFKGLTGGGNILSKITGGLGMVGSIIGVAGSLFKGIKSLFGGKSKEQKAAEAAAKQQAADEAKAKAQQAAEARQAAAQQAKGFAEALSDKIAAGGLSDKLTGALSAFVGKMGDALGKLGLGIVDARLKDSKEFQAASGVAGDVAGALGAAGQAGIVDSGLMAAASGAAEAIQQDAITAARAAGLSDMEAARQGSLAIAQILREQLHASIRSGNELDENTRRLLEEAKKNGIEIIADPMVESLGVQREILATLRGQGGKGASPYYDGGGAEGGAPGESGPPPSTGPSYEDMALYDPEAGVRRRKIPAAAGFGPMITPNMGGGLGPLIQTHPGELAMVIPRSRVGQDGILSAAGGLYTDRAASTARTVVNYSLNVAPTLTPLSSVESQREAVVLVTSALGEIMRANNNRLIREIADAVRARL